MTTVAEVRLWGRRIGAIALTDSAAVADFEYTPEFVGSGIQVAPLTMPLARQIYRFPELAPATFHGLPGMLADSLPDKFGNALIDAWLAAEGRSPASFNAIERLCYIGTRGMGALEFAPAAGPAARGSADVQIDQLVELASDILSARSDFTTSFASAARERALRDILRVGTSAGGARAKAVLAWNPTTNQVRSGQIEAEPGFEYWILKFDGVAANRDKELDTPQGYGAIEYAYSLMARDCGIHMSPTRLFEEGERRHFMSRRFDRDAAGRKIHMQSLCALAHFDFNQAGAYSYEQALAVMRRLELPMAELEEQFRRMVFNVVARNQDDHVKNIAFLMDKAGRWSLSPAFDVTHSYNPTGTWTSTHQMSINGKRDNFTLDDLRACARTAGLKRGRAEAIVREVTAVVAKWPRYASDVGVPGSWQNQVQTTFRLAL